ncbi:MAG: TonB-dependent receptor [Bacteroidetes bacterium]|nr:TonB-dependent receptor [Rhodothermia bacterium]MCS7155769.1 TonB-dependent receptor [Bacteroidota bacterium]MCX7906130.1 TonB-dependent receptor [Bacteroidota bacterium]MDW8138258.1 TonB-dependent receptor [Bacteroidota bacterium]MDW8285942.1 TonB-dependent receptor [Bacteroidota bacterium]
MKGTLWLAAVLLVATASGLLAQSRGLVTGRVVDAQTGEALIGVNVVVVGTTQGTTTDVEGRFHLSLPPGRHTLLFRYIGYRPFRAENAEVRPGGVLELAVALQPEAFEVGEVVVEAQALRNTEAALLALQRRAPMVSDGLASEQIRRAPDPTSADALRRVTGVSVLGGRYLYVRGIPERYSVALLNGAPLAGTEPDRRSFAFDLVPAELLDHAQILKSFTPDQPGDFSGGVVRLQTVDFPAQLIVRLSGSGAWNAAATGRAFWTYPGSRFWGLEDGRRRLPSGFPQDISALPVAERHQAARQLSAVWAPSVSRSPANMSWGLSIGDGSRLLGRSFGFVASASYRNGYVIESLVRREYEASGDARFAYTGQRHAFSVLWGGLLNLNLRLGGAHRLSWRNLYTRAAEDEVIRLEGIQYTDAGAEQRQTALRFTSRGLYAGQLEGLHAFSLLGNAELRWSLRYSQSRREEPDYRRYLYARPADSQGPFAAVLGFQANLKNGGRFYSDMSERTYGLEWDLRKPVGEARISLGGGWEDRSRRFWARLIGVVINAPGNGFTDFRLLYLPPDSLFRPEHFRRNGLALDEYRNGTNRYRAGLELGNGYLMLDWPLRIGPGQTLRLVGGVRGELARVWLRTRDFSDQRDLVVERRKIDLLPGLNLTYNPIERMNLRLAWSRTVNRPELRELAPFTYFDFQTQTSIRGDTSLHRASVHNWDLRWELYPGIGEILAFGVFYKRFRHPIEQVIVSGSALGSERTFANADRAENGGFELDLRLALSRFLGEWARPWRAQFNYAWIRSRVFVPGTETTIAREGRPLQGQSPYVLNAALFYETERTSLSLLYNRIGSRIVEVATAYEEDIVEEPRDVLDFVLSYRLHRAWTLRLSARDLLAPPQRFMQGGKLVRENSRAPTWSLGLSWNP